MTESHPRKRFPFDKMESEDDDFYEPGPATLTDPVGAAVGESKPSSSGVKAADVAGSTMEAKLMADLEEGEEEEEEAEDTDDSVGDNPPIDSRSTAPTVDISVPPGY